MTKQEARNLLKYHTRKLHVENYIFAARKCAEESGQKPDEYWANMDRQQVIDDYEDYLLALKHDRMQKY